MSATVIDDGEWLVRENVPVYDSHIVVDKETGEETVMDKGRLQKIADKMNLRYETTGEESPIVIGHTRDGLPEWKQPPIVGYAHDFYVEDHPKAKRPFLYAKTYKLHKTSTVGGEELTAEEILKRFPRRSAEVWLPDDMIDPLSLLGATTPMRDLGLVRNEKPKKYQMGGGMDLAAMLTALKAIVSQLEQTVGPPELAVGEEEPESPFGDDAEEPPIQESADSGDATDGSPDDALEGDSGEPDEKPKKFEKTEKTGAECADPVLERVKMQKDTEAIKTRLLEERLAAVETANKQLKEQHKLERLKYQKAVRGADLKQLLAEGYAIEVEEELEDLVDLPDDKYAKELDRRRKRYARVPVGEDFIQTARIQEGGPSAPTKELCQRAAAYAASSGKEYKAVLRAMQGGEL